MHDKVQTLADLLRADPSKIQILGGNTFGCNNQTYCVVTETEKGAGPGTAWRWIGQLGHIHVFRKNRE
jgi:hypothetical protein